MIKNLLILISVIFFITGCGSSNKEYEKIKEENKRLKSELADCQKRLKAKTMGRRGEMRNDFASGNKMKPGDSSPSTPHESKYVSWYANGNVKEEVGTNANEDWHGKYVSYYENGKKREEGEYYNGKKHGKWKKWDEHGNLIEEVE